MASRVIRDVSSPSFGITKELVKPKTACKSTRREYMRMMEERELRKKAENYPNTKPVRQPASTLTSNGVPSSSNVEVNVLSPENETIEVVVPEPVRPVATATVIVRRDTEPEVKPFPLENQSTDSIDGSCNVDQNGKHLGASGLPRAEHGARMCMISAVVHMKCLARRKAKSIQQLRKVPITTLEEDTLKNHKKSDDVSDDEVQEVGDMTYLKSCRYLRGVDGDKELSVEEIFNY